MLIPLTRGFSALVDDTDYELVAFRKWHALRYQRKDGSELVYACRTEFPDGKKTLLHMHRVLLSAPPGMEVDHVNGCGIDNRRTNIRLATRSQNGANTLSPTRPSNSGFRGVRAIGHGYHALIKGRRIGTYKTAVEAAAVRDAAAIEIFGEFAILNHAGGS